MKLWAGSRARGELAARDGMEWESEGAGGCGRGPKDKAKMLRERKKRTRRLLRGVDANGSFSGLVATLCNAGYQLCKKC